MFFRTSVSFVRDFRLLVQWSVIIGTILKLTRLNEVSLNLTIKKMKKIIDFFDVELLFKCFCLWIFLYSGFIAIVEVSLYYILIPVIIHFVILHFSITPQNEEKVKAIFGENPRTRLRETVDLDRSIDSDLNSSFSIAHKAAALDFCHSSVEAVKLV